jgi:hypothetical protein
MLARHTGDSAKVAEARERCLQMSREHYRGHIVQAQTPSDKAIVDLRVDGKSSTDRVAVAHVAHGHAAINTSVACAYTGTGPALHLLHLHRAEDYARHTRTATSVLTKKVLYVEVSRSQSVGCEYCSVP